MDQPRPFTGAAALVINNFIFVCGGQVAGATSDQCHCFNPITAKWTTLTPMLRPRRNFTIAAVGYNIYAIGGVSGGNIPTNTVERYSISEDQWCSTASLPDIALADMCSCTWNHKIFVAAGVDENCIHTKEFRVLDTEMQPEPKWVRKANLPQVKFAPVMFPSKDCIYLVDLYRSEGSAAHLDQYNIASDQWTNIQLPSVHFSRTFSAVMIQDWIYFVGKFLRGMSLEKHVFQN